MAAFTEQNVDKIAGTSKSAASASSLFWNNFPFPSSRLLLWPPERNVPAVSFSLSPKFSAELCFKFQEGMLPQGRSLSALSTVYGPQPNTSLWGLLCPLYVLRNDTVLLVHCGIKRKNLSYLFLKWMECNCWGWIQWNQGKPLWFSPLLLEYKEINLTWDRRKKNDYMAGGGRLYVVFFLKKEVNRHCSTALFISSIKPVH